MSEPLFCRAGNRGSVLILALWVIFLLALLAVAVGAHIDGRLALARRMEQRTLGWYAAYTGMTRSLTCAQQDTNIWDSASDSWANNPGLFSNQVCGSGVYSVFYEVDLSGGGRGTNYGVWDEQSKIDVNLARVELLASLFKVAGRLSSENASKLADVMSTVRSKDVSNTPGLSAKTGWVDSHLERGPFKSIQEIRWVKGMTEDLFKNIEGHVTVHGGYRVNLNTADAVVLGVLANAASGGTRTGAETLTRKILQFRERGGSFKGIAFGEALGPDARLTSDENLLLVGMAPYVTVSTGHLRGHVEGALSGKAGERRKLDFVWDRNHHQIEFWHED